MSERHEVELVYDRQCPICDYYCQRIDVDESAGKLVRIDAREDTQIMREITEIGLDIDEGMVLKVDNTMFYGSDAIHQLALLSSRKGFVNRFAYFVFRSPELARRLCPLQAMCRNLLLKVLRRTRINNLDIEHNDRF